MQESHGFVQHWELAVQPLPAKIPIFTLKMFLYVFWFFFLGFTKFNIPWTFKKLFSKVPQERNVVPQNESWKMCKVNPVCKVTPVYGMQLYYCGFTNTSASLSTFEIVSFESRKMH